MQLLIPREREGGRERERERLREGGREREGEIMQSLIPKPVPFLPSLSSTHCSLLHGTVDVMTRPYQYHFSSRRFINTNYNDQILLVITNTVESAYFEVIRIQKGLRII